MKTLKKNKLALSTETLAPLTGAALDAVNGGQITGQTGGLTSDLTDKFTARCSLPTSFRCQSGQA